MHKVNTTALVSFFGDHAFIDMTLEHLLQEGSLFGTSLIIVDISLFSALGLPCQLDDKLSG
jgi:hypothetical protein